MIFFFLVLKQVNAVVVVIISMIHMQKYCVPDVVENLNIKAFNLKALIQACQELMEQDT